MCPETRPALPESETSDDTPLLEEPLSPEELHAHELRLRKLLESLECEVEDVEDEFLRPSGGERYQPDDESLEEGALDLELETLALEDELGYEVREALERLREGTFGTCATCGEWIPRARLQQVPYARECIECVRKRVPEARGRHG